MSETTTETETERVPSPMAQMWERALRRNMVSLVTATVMLGLSLAVVALNAVNGEPVLGWISAAILSGALLLSALGNRRLIQAALIRETSLRDMVRQMVADLPEEQPSTDLRTTFFAGVMSGYEQVARGAGWLR